MDFGLGFVMILMPSFLLAVFFLIWLYTKSGKKWLENM